MTGSFRSAAGEHAPAKALMLFEAPHGRHIAQSAHLLVATEPSPTPQSTPQRRITEQSQYNTRMDQEHRQTSKTGYPAKPGSVKESDNHQF